VSPGLRFLYCAESLRKQGRVYHAALLDPHTSAELTIVEIVSMVDDLFEAHREMIPRYD